MQCCPAKHLAGQAVRLEAELKTDDVSGWAGMWLRADGEEISSLVFENMHQRPILGTIGWTRYSIEAHLPDQTAWLNHGLLLSGKGTVWADDFRLMLWSEAGRWEDV